MKNGIAGSGGGGANVIGDLAGLGVGLGAMGSVIGMTKDAIQPVSDVASQMGQSLGSAISDLWDCHCGQKGNAGNFCSNCGAKRPEQKTGWDCACGQKGNMGNFCSNCGAKKPENSSLIWDCACGKKGITGNFCDNCGKKRGE